MKNKFYPAEKLKFDTNGWSEPLSDFIDLIQDDIISMNHLLSDSKRLCKGMKILNFIKEEHIVWDNSSYKEYALKDGLYIRDNEAYTHFSFVPLTSTGKEKNILQNYFLQ